MKDGWIQDNQIWDMWILDVRKTRERGVSGGGGGGWEVNCVGFF